MSKAPRLIEQAPTWIILGLAWAFFNPTISMICMGVVAVLCRLEEPTT